MAEKERVHTICDEEKSSDNEFVIGVLGGMGTYATIHLFQQYAKIFPAEKEWERPRILIDNRCTMPSRVKAFLYHENESELIEQMTDSLKNLLYAGCNRIVLACNTSHLFLPQIYDRIPDLKEYMVNIIEKCVSEVEKRRLSEIHLLGSEGTIESRVYNSALADKGILCSEPNREEYYLIRECIEAVKRNDYSGDEKRIFLDLINKSNACILGCTELPILWNKYKDEVSCEVVLDPLNIALKSIRKEFISNKGA